jgi:DNA-directed RNA polymerase II subunit RPB2
VANRRFCTLYDFNDAEMMDLLRPSIEEAFCINSEQLALDYIGSKRSQVRLL